jgi:hypothetical protein
VKSSMHSIAGLMGPRLSDWIIVDHAMSGERVLGEFSTVIALAANRTNGVPCPLLGRLGREGIL